MGRRRKARGDSTPPPRATAPARARADRRSERAGPRPRNARRSSRCKPGAPAPRPRSCGSSRRCRRSPARHPPAPSALWRRLASASFAPGAIRPASTRLAKAMRGSLRFVGAVVSVGRIERLDRVDARLRGVGIGVIALDAEVIAAQALGDRASGAAAKKRIEHEVAGVRGREHHPRQKGFRLLRRMGFSPLRVLEAFAARADREQPVGTHLAVFIRGLQRFVIEGVALGLRRRARPRSWSHGRW